MADEIINEERLEKTAETIVQHVKTYVDNNSGGTSYSSFSEASVDEIKEVIEKGLYRTVYHIGDTRKITLSDGYTYTARILDFDTYYQSNSLERVHILLGFDELLSTTYNMNSSNTNKGGWKESLLRTNLESLYQDNKDKDIFSICVQSAVYTNGTGFVSGYEVSDDHFFIPSLIEVYGGDQIRDSKALDMIKYGNAYSGEGHQYEWYRRMNPLLMQYFDVSMFSDSYFEGEKYWLEYYANQNMIKYQVNSTTKSSTSGSWYWTRSSCLSISDFFWYIGAGGGLGGSGAGYSSGVALCWCI